MNDPEFIAYCLELLAPAGAARARRMFGGHGLYVDELFIAIALGDRLYLKTDGSSRQAFEDAGCEPFVYDGQGKSITTGYWSAPAEAMESPALMQPWARRAVQAALAARTASIKRKAPAAAPTAAASARPAPTKRRVRR